MLLCMEEELSGSVHVDGGVGVLMLVKEEEGRRPL